MVMTEAWAELKHDRKAVERVIAALAATFGNRLVTSQAVREQHGNTLTWIGNQPPDAVVFPQSTEDVQRIVRLCAAERVPVIGFGAGTSLEGQINAPRGGVSLDFRDMNRVLAVHADDLDCVVEPGITRKQLNEYLRDQGLFFPIDPGADASLGGMASTRASGTNAVRYGTMKDNVLSLKVVLANGEVMTTATRAKKSSSGYDLTRLIVGAEGTLGHHHRADAAALRYSGDDLGRRLSVSFGRGRLQGDDHDHPVRHSGGADRAVRCLAGARRQLVFEAELAGDADAVSGISRHRGGRRRAIAALRRNRAGVRRRSVRLGDQGRGSHAVVAGASRRLLGAARASPRRRGARVRRLRSDFAARRMFDRDAARYRRE